MGIKIRAITPNVKTWSSTGHTNNSIVVSSVGTGDLSHLSKDDLNDLYKNYIEPSVEKNPLFMGSPAGLVELAGTYYNLYLEEKNDFVKCILQILSEITNVLACSKTYYFDKSIIQGQYDDIKQKYELQITEIATLKERINVLENGESRATTGLIGTSKHSLVMLKNPIYLMAKFNLERAWYYYIYKKETSDKVDLKLLAQIRDYLRKTYENKNLAYKKLVELLDERFE